MRTYILGAGASHHVGYPLTPGLWEVLAEWMDKHNEPYHREQRQKIEREHPLLLGDVEKLMMTLDKGTRRYLRHAISVCFNGIRLQPATAYSSFADKCVQTGDTIISFNYDVSLERELNRAGKWNVGKGYGFDISPGSTLDSPVKVLKLHGSTNWCGDQQFNQLIPPSAALRSRPVIKQADIKFLGSQNLRDHHCDDEDGTYDRALILPAFDKRFYFQFLDADIWVEFWNDLVKQAENSLRESEELIVIGYSFPDADHSEQTLILDHTNRDAKISIYSIEQNERIAEKFRSKGFTNVQAYSKVKFEDWVQL